MKNLSYLSMLLFVVVFIFSCTPCPDCPDSSAKYDYTAQLKDTISNAKFDLWVSNWKNHGLQYTEGTLTEYFTMPTLDLEEFLAHPGVGSDTIAAARFVLGLEIKTPDTIPHLVLVGVNSSGGNMTDPTRGQYIYDVSKPCPTLCGSASLPSKN